MSRPTAAAPASPSTPIGQPMRRGAILRSTRSFSPPTARSTIRSGGLRQMIAIEPAVDPLRRLAALVEVDGEGAVALAARLRFSNSWRDRLHGLAPPWPLDPWGDVQAQRRALYRLGAERYRDVALL